MHPRDKVNIELKEENMRLRKALFEGLLYFYTKGPKAHVAEKMRKALGFACQRCRYDYLGNLERSCGRRDCER